METENLNNTVENTFGKMDEQPLKEVFPDNIFSHNPHNTDGIKYKIPTTSLNTTNNDKENVYEDIEQENSTFSKTLTPEAVDESSTTTGLSKPRPSLLFNFDPLFSKKHSSTDCSLTLSSISENENNDLDNLTEKLSSFHIDKFENVSNHVGCSRNECKFFEIDETVDLCSGANGNLEISNTFFELNTTDTKSGLENTNAVIIENQLELSKSTTDTNVITEQVANVEATFCEHESSTNINYTSPKNSATENLENTIDISTSFNSVNILDTNISVSSKDVDELNNTSIELEDLDSVELITKNFPNPDTFEKNTNNSDAQCTSVNISNEENFTNSNSNSSQYILNHTFELEHLNSSAHNSEDNKLENIVHSTEDSFKLVEECPNANTFDNDIKRSPVQCSISDISNEGIYTNSNQSGQGNLNHVSELEHCNCSAQDLEKNILENNVNSTQDNHELVEEGPNTSVNDNKRSTQCTNVDGEISINSNQSREVEHMNTSLEGNKLENTIHEPADVNSFNKTLVDHKISPEKNKHKIVRMENIVSESAKIIDENISNENISNEFIPSSADKEAQALNDKVVGLEEEVKQLQLLLSESQEACANLVLKINQNNETFEREIKELNKKLEEKDDSKELQELIKQEAKFKSELDQSQSQIKNYRRIIEEYEKTMGREFSQFEEMKNEHIVVNQHLTNLEHAFSDVHQKYERSKKIIEGYKSNEDTLLKSLAAAEGNAKKFVEEYEAFKTYARDVIENSNKEIYSIRQQHVGEINKLNRTIKRLEIKNASLQESLDQKNKECVALSVLCDEVTGRV